MAQSGGRIQVFTFPGMLHAKLLISEKTLTLGSCNITKKAFRQLDELNLFVPNDGSAFACAVCENVEATFAASQKLACCPSYRSTVAAIESLLV